MPKGILPYLPALGSHHNLLGSFSLQHTNHTNNYVPLTGREGGKNTTHDDRMDMLKAKVSHS
jgi:hypothetical protein